jgi:hypothetical protein
VQTTRGQLHHPTREQVRGIERDTDLHRADHADLALEERDHAQDEKGCRDVAELERHHGEQQPAQ